MKKFLLITLITLTAAVKLFSQEVVRVSDILNTVRCDSAAGELRIIQDPRVDTLFSRQIAVNKELGGVPGFRILIYRRGGPNARPEAARIVLDIHNRLPELAVYEDFESPDYWIVRAGDYRTRLEATKAIAAVRRFYPDAYIVPARINVPEKTIVD